MQKKVSFYIPTVSSRRFQFLHVFPILVVFHCFDNCHTDECEVVSHLLLVCISLMTNDIDHLFVHLLTPYFCVFFGEVSV